MNEKLIERLKQTKADAPRLGQVGTHKALEMALTRTVAGVGFLTYPRPMRIDAISDVHTDRYHWENKYGVHSTHTYHPDKESLCTDDHKLLAEAIYVLFGGTTWHDLPTVYEPSPSDVMPDAWGHEGD